MDAVVGPRAVDSKPDRGGPRRDETPKRAQGRLGVKMGPWLLVDWLRSRMSTAKGASDVNKAVGWAEPG